MADRVEDDFAAAYDVASYYMKQAGERGVGRYARDGQRDSQGETSQDDSRDDVSDARREDSRHEPRPDRLAKHQEAPQEPQRVSMGDSGTGVPERSQKAVSGVQKPRKASSKPRDRRGSSKQSTRKTPTRSARRPKAVAAPDADPYINENMKLGEGVALKQVRGIARFMFDDMERDLREPCDKAHRTSSLNDCDIAMAWIAAHSGRIDERLPYQVRRVAKEYADALADENVVQRLSIEVAGLRQQVAKLTEDLATVLQLASLIAVDRLSLHDEQIWDAYANRPDRVRWDDPAIDGLVASARDALREKRRQGREDEHREFVRNHPNARRG